MDETANMRTEMLIDKAAAAELKNCRVAVFGVGGVGGYAVEALARAGVGSIDLIDNDTVSLSNINRQIIALHSTVGRYKVDVLRERILDINPDCNVICHKVFLLPDTADKFDFSQYDYIIDAIDTVTGKKQLILSAKAAATPIISAMGAGNKLGTAAFEVADIYDTSVCPLARVMRGICKENGIRKLKVVYSKEPPIKSSENSNSGEKQTPGSISFVPALCGLTIAGEVVRELIGK